MATGLIALLDDVVAISKVAAASLDDITAQAAKAGAKAAGVVIDDAAVTPKYATGFAADRELPIIGRIALGSLRNKLLILLPAALLLSEFAPWAITPLLMLGGLYLCYEGAEKLLEVLGLVEHHADAGAAGTADPKKLEDQKVAGAIQTDFILSAEIMAIALATIDDPVLLDKALILGAVAVFITVAVYGAVALIVKADDAGVALARPEHSAPVRALGRGLVTGMPKFLAVLSVVGTVAMLWVGGGIIAHGLHELGVHRPEDLLKAASAIGATAPILPGVAAWLLHALAAAVFGAALGGIVLLAFQAFARRH